MESTKPEDNQENTKKTLGEIFSRYPFETQQQDRILHLLSSNTLAKQVLNKYGPKTEPYKVFEKKERVPGFRAGHANPQLMHRLIDYLKNPQAVQYRICWDIYRYAAIKFVTTELEALNTLLAEVVYEGNDQDANELLKCVCSNAFDYDVKSDAVSKLYELWWIDRTENIDAMLKLCSEVNEQRALSKMISGISERLKELEKSVQSLTVESTSNKHARTQSEEQTAKDQERIQNCEAQNLAHAKQVGESLSTLREHSDRQFEKLENKLVQLGERVDGLKTNLASKISAVSLEAQLKSLVEQNTLLAESVQATVQSNFERTTIDFTAKIDDLEQRLASVCSQLLSPDKTSKVGTSTAIYKSPLSYSLPSNAPPSKISKEIDFINSWSNSLLRHKQLLIGAEQLFAYHSVLLANHVIVCDLMLVDTWIDCLGWRAFSKPVVVSPIWSREEDWADGVQHLFGDLGNSRMPRLLVMHNYDCGIIECYLIPTLLLWSLRSPANGLPVKIFLVPGGDKSATTHELMDHAAYIEPLSAKTETKIRFSGTPPAMPPIRGEIPVGVDPKTAAQWLQAAMTFNYDLATIQKPFNIHFNERLTTNFENTVSAARKYFDERSAIGIGMRHHVLPWIKSRYPDQYDAVLAFVSQLPDILC